MEREPFKNTTFGVIFLGVISGLIATYIWSTNSWRLGPWPPPPPGTPTPVKIDLNSLAGTRWLGRVGRAPASLDILPCTAAGDCTARMRYTGIAEDLAMTINANGGIAFTGKTYRREIGNGAFALDTFSGRLSPDGQHLRGTLIDGAGLHGIWNVTKAQNASQILAATTSLLSPDSVSTTHWQGTIGKSVISLDIFPRKSSGEWIAKAAYRGVIEELTVIIEDNGTVVLSGRSYQGQADVGVFSLRTFYGELSSDGNHLQGLRIDNIGKRDPWEVGKTGSSIEHR